MLVAIVFDCVFSLFWVFDCMFCGVVFVLFTLLWLLCCRLYCCNSVCVLYCTVFVFTINFDVLFVVVGRLDCMICYLDRTGYLCLSLLLGCFGLSVCCLLGLRFYLVLVGYLLVG